MRASSLRTMTVIAAAAALALACGDKKPKPKDGSDAKPAAGEAAPATEAEKAEVRGTLATWLGDEASKRVSTLMTGLATELALKISSDEKVMAELSKLSTTILRDKEVRKLTDKIADKATSGFINKMKLAWKALQKGGVDEYKAEVKEKTTRIATEVINAHIKDAVLKDPRMAELIKKFTPLLQLQAKIAAISVQENLSPESSKKLLGLTLKLTVAGKADATSKKVEAWTQRCDGHVEAEIEKLFKQVVRLKSLDAALQKLAVEVIGHQRTAAELSAMMAVIMKDKDAQAAMTKAYENAAFDKGDKAIRESIEKIVALPVVDTELFAALGRLAEAEGAGGIMERQLAPVGADPEMAKLVDAFLISVLQTCGDPVK